MSDPSPPPRDVTLQEMRERLRLLENSTLAALMASCGGAGLLWFVQVLPLEIEPAARAAFSYALGYLVLAQAAERLQRPRALAAATVLLRAASLIVLGLVWHLLGGLYDPMLLLAFALPVVAAGIVLGTRAALAEAVGSVAVAGVVALAESPELGWYVFQLGVPIGRLVPSLAPRPHAAELFPGLAAQPAYVFILLALFAVVQVCVALVAGGLSLALRRRRRREEITEAAQTAARHAFQAALRSAAVPTVLAFADTARVLLASESFRQAMLRHGEELSGRDLFELVTFADPERVRELLEKGGELAFCPCQVGPESRVVQLRAFSFKHEETTLACVTFEDRTDLLYLRAAFEASEEALLVIGQDLRLRYANRAAGGLLGELYYGMEAAAAWQNLDGAGATLEASWEGERLLDVGGRALRVHQSTLPLAGGSEVVRMVRLRPAPPAGEPS